MRAGEMISPRHRLPNRRRSETTELAVDNTTVIATIGFDEAGTPKEVFLVGGKSGSNLDFMLADASVAISVAMQHSIPELRLGGRLPFEFPRLQQSIPPHWYAKTGAAANVRRRLHEKGPKISRIRRLQFDDMDTAFALAGKSRIRNLPRRLGS